MIDPKCLTESWLQEKGSALKARDVQNLEKCILALELVGRLRQAGLEFIFKGGTSLVLLLDPVRRLSIDVDILCLEPLDRLREVLDAVANDRPPFTKWNHQDHRDREAPPTKHFQVYYQSEINTRGAPSVQIDVMETESPYARIVEVPIQTGFIEVEESVSVRIPSASSLLADKLAAFAPTTIGYRYKPIETRPGRASESRQIKIIKHLYDLGELTLLSIDLAEAIATYEKVHAEQAAISGRACTREQALTDSQQAAFWVSRIAGRKFKPNEQTEFLAKGIKSLDSHLFTMPFKRGDSRIAAGRAALIAEIIRHRAADFDLSAALTRMPTHDDVLEEPWQDLQGLSGTDPNAFAARHAAQQLRNTLQQTGPL